MLKTITRFMASLFVVCGVYWLYAKAAVPLIEPSVAKGAKRAATADAAHPIRSRYDLAKLFPPGAWELDRPKMVETNQGMLLIKDYETIYDENLKTTVLKITPCTMVLFSGDEHDDDRRPFILQAPGGAELQFDSGVDISSGEFGPLRGGQLIGEITIHSPASAAGANDDVHIVTRNVQIDRRRIMAPHDVRLRYGPHVGQGRDLIITLADGEGDGKSLAGGAALGSIETLELVHVDRLTLRVDEGALLPKSLSSNVRSPRSAAPGALPASGAASPLDEVQITCAGPFVFDVAQRQAWFEENVEAVRLSSFGPADSLRCHRLLIEMAGGEGETSKNGELTRLRMARVVASGAPAGASQPAPPGNVVIHYGGFQIESPQIEYEPPPGDPKGLGKLRAAGPGSFAAQSDSAQSDSAQSEDEAPSSINAFWSGELQFRPFQQNQVLSLYASQQPTTAPGEEAAAAPRGDGYVRVGVAGQGVVTAGEAHLYLLQVDANDPAAKTFQAIIDSQKKPPAAAPATTAAPLAAERREGRMAIVPDRMLAKERVTFDSPLLVGDADEINVWFDYSAAPLAPAAGASAPTGPSSPLQVPRLEAASAPRRRYELHGDLVQVKLAMAAPQPQVDDITISGETREASFAETPAGGGDAQPLSVQGRVLRLYDGVTANPKLKIEGAPAAVTVRGLTVSAAAIRAHRGENRLWIDGEGTASMAGALAARSGIPGGPRRVAIAWRDGMTFDGWQVRAGGAVTVDGEHVLESGDLLRSRAWGENAVLTLDRRVDFAQADEVEEAQPRLLELTGPVRVENVTTNMRGEQQSFDQMHLLDPEIHVQTGAIKAHGAGWISTVRYGRELSRGGGPVNAAANRPARLTFLRINYKDGLTGNHLKREITFHTVRAFTTPAGDWTDQFDPDVIDDLRKNEMLLTCRRLKVVDMGATIGSGAALEMTAEGDAVVQSERFKATGERVTYSQEKDTLRLQGDGRQRVTITGNLVPGQNKPSSFTARQLTYGLETGTLDGEDIQSATINGVPTRSFER